MVYGLPVSFLCSVFSWDVVSQFSVPTTCWYSFMPRWTLILLEPWVRITTWVLKLLLIVVLYPSDKNVTDTPRLKAYDELKFSMEVDGSRILGVWQLLWNLTLTICSCEVKHAKTLLNTDDFRPMFHSSSAKQKHWITRGPRHTCSKVCLSFIPGHAVLSWITKASGINSS